MHMPFFTFLYIYTLLCALVTINTTHAIYFFLIHHCTKSLSPLHIFVHHCTFCASLHTKTSPANPNTNPRTLTALNLTLTDPHGAFESFCAPIFCDFIRNCYVRTRAYRHFVHIITVTLL